MSVVPPGPVVPTQSEISSHEVLISFDNFALSAAGATASTDDYNPIATMPIEDALVERLDTAWKVDGDWFDYCAQTGIPITVTINLGQRRVVDFVSLHGTNLARFPFKFSLHREDPLTGGPASYTSDWIDPIVKAKLADFDWLDLPWNLGPPSAKLDAWAAAFDLHSYARADQPYYGIQYVQIAFNCHWRTIDPDVTMQIGLINVSRVLQPRINMLLDWEQGVVDRAIVRRSEGGALLGRRRTSGKTIAFVLGWVERDEAFEEIFDDWIATYGLLGRVFVIPEPQQRRYYYRQAIFGTVTELPQVAMAALEYPAARGFVIEQTE